MCCASLLETVTEQSAVTVLLAQIKQNQMGLEELGNEPVLCRRAEHPGPQGILFLLEE